MFSFAFFATNANADGFSFSFGGGLPSGNYQDTCNGCYLFGNELTCSCQQENGYWDNTSMHVGHRCNDVENANGQLECTHWRHHHHHHWYWHHHHWHHHHHYRHDVVVY